MLSVQLYTVRDRLAADRAGTLRRLAEIGFDAVEPFDPTNDPAGFRQLVDDLGLAVSSTHAFALLEREPAEVLDAVATIGTTLVIVPAGLPHEDFTTRDGLERAADRLNELAEHAAGYGMRLGYHNHWWEIEPTFGDRHAIELLADLLTPSAFLQIDTYWAAVGGADVPDLLRRLGDRVHALHLKDGPVRRGEPHTALGAGAMPVPSILEAAPHALRIAELDECATDMFDALADSRAYLASLEAA
jgi:sugar phosphate isomerase/epimerase